MEERIKFLRLLESGNISGAVEIAVSSSSDREILLAALGDFFLESKNFLMAKNFYAESIRHRPNPSAEFGFGSALLAEGTVKESIPFLQSASKSQEYAIKSLLKIGMAKRLLGDIRGSLTAYLEASSMGYDKYILDVNVATLLSDLGEFDRAGAYYERAFKKAPEDPKVRFNYSLHLLSDGDFSTGFDLYESRPWCFRGHGREWSGEHGENVLVIAEQGYGDLINFCRFVRDVRLVSSRVALACDGNIAGLMSGLDGIDEIVDLDEESIRKASEKYPFYCRVMSIPRILSLDVKSSSVPYLKPDPSRVNHWKTLLSDGDFNVGICWQGGKRSHSEMIFNDRKRSVDLGLLEPLLKVEGAKFYSLQKDWKEPHERIVDIMSECGDFLDAASLISCMDLVISVDTAIAHVAGSIGAPVWMLARLGGCWRWGNGGEFTFWYPSMTVLRQEKMDDWGPVVSEVSARLSGLVSSREKH